MAGTVATFDEGVVNYVAKVVDLCLDTIRANITKLGSDDSLIVDNRVGMWIALVASTESTRVTTVERPLKFIFVNDKFVAMGVMTLTSDPTLTTLVSHRTTTESATPVGTAEYADIVEVLTLIKSRQPKPTTK